MATTTAAATASRACGDFPRLDCTATCNGCAQGQKCNGRNVVLTDSLTSHFKSAMQAVSTAVIIVLAFVGLSTAASSATQAQAQDHAQTVLTKTAQVHDFAPDSSQSVRLRLTGTITYYDSADRILFLQDATGGVFIQTDKTYPIHTGDSVMLDGISSTGYRTEVANDPAIQVLGSGNAVAPTQADYRELVSGRVDSKLVTIHGTVRAADWEQHANGGSPTVHLDLAMPDGELQAYIHPSSEFHPESLLDAAVEITGVAAAAVDGKNQLIGIRLYAPEPSSMRILLKSSVSPRQLPLTSIDDVFSSRRVTDASPAVRVRGTLTYYKKGDSAVLENNGHSIYVQTLATSDFSIGDVVDAVGFASSREYAPSLRQASLVSTGSKQPIAPHAVSYTDVAGGKYSDDLVSVTGVLVSQLQDVDSTTLVMNINGHLVTAHLEEKLAADDYQIGSRIQVSGICRMAPGSEGRAPALSHLEMRNADDLRLVSKPTWYSMQSLVQLLSALSVMALAVAIWAAFLKRRVVNQTAWIDRSVIIAKERSRLLELISSNHNLDELLTEICRSTAELLPGAECTYSLQLDGATYAARATEEPVTTGGITLYEVALRDSGEQIVGRIVVTPTDSHVLAVDRHEVYDSLSELAALAMRQSLLYRGLVHHSTHDPLTELPNRRLCESRMASALKEAEESCGQLAIIYIDINRFKHVNDQHGHKTGDLYLQAISSRLGSQIRPIDMLARIGGDEFVVIAPFPEGFDRSHALTARLESCFDDPFDLEGISINGSASFGFARYPEHGRTEEELTRHADHAMYVSKHNEARIAEGAHGIAIITSDELELALLGQRFRLAYQPQFSAAGRLTGLETLIRLEDPVLGIITPDAFISVAERHRVIVDIGAWTLRCALQDAIRWGLHTGEPLLLAVNVSVRQLEEPGYAKSVLACLRENGFPPERLEIELIERSLMFSGDVVSRQLVELRDAGVRISLDDFGTGQSCLSLLHRLPIDTIKLDRSFIRAMDDEPTVLPVIQAIISMAHSLGKRVVAEAIEHVGPVPTLMKMGKMDFQGYLLSRPIPAEEVPSFIRKWRSGITMPDAFVDGGIKIVKQLAS